MLSKDRPMSQVDSIALSDDKSGVQEGDERKIVADKNRKRVSLSQMNVTPLVKTVHQTASHGGKMIPVTRSRSKVDMNENATEAVIQSVDVSSINSGLSPEFSVYLAKVEEAQSDVLPADFYRSARDRKRHAFKTAIDLFKRHGGRRSEHIEFIKSSLKLMKAYGVNRDLEVYRQLLEVMPKGKYVIRNIFQSMFMHYPQQQYGLNELIDAMNQNLVQPDREFGEMLKNITGFDSRPYKMYAAQMYWMPKLQGANAWPLPLELPEDGLVLARMALQRITSKDPLTEISVHMPDSLPPGAADMTWIVSGQSPLQGRLINDIDKEKTTLFVEGPFRVWLRDQQVNYYVLRGPGRVPAPPIEVEHDDTSHMRVWTLGQTSGLDGQQCGVAESELSLHQQEDGTIYACCATGTSSRDSLLSWIRILESANTGLQGVPILFSMTSPLGPVVPVDSSANHIRPSEAM